MKTKAPFREFRVIGCKLPTEEEPETPLYRMRIFAPTLLSPNLGFDQAWFWYFYVNWGSSRKLQTRLPALKRSLRRNLWRSKISVSGSVTGKSLSEPLIFASTDCSLNNKFNTWKFKAQTWEEHVVYRNCFWHSEQFLYTTLWRLFTSLAARLVSSRVTFACAA